MDHYFALKYIVKITPKLMCRWLASQPICMHACMHNPRIIITKIIFVIRKTG